MRKTDFRVSYRNSLNGWNESTFEKYFVGPNPLFTTQIFIPKINAGQGPLAFGLGGRVQPKMWVVHYKGKCHSD